MEALKNVFDSKDEFEKLRGFILEGIQKFSEYRGGNLTYGEIMYVLECELDAMRNTSEKEARKNIKHHGKSVSFSTLLENQSRLVESLLKKGALTSQDESYILHGDD